MNSKKIITTLVALISLFAAVAATFDIFSSSGDGTFMHESVRGQG